MLVLLVRLRLLHWCIVALRILLLLLLVELLLRVLLMLLLLHADLMHDAR